MSDLFSDGMARARQAAGPGQHRLTMVGSWPRCSCGYEPAAEEAHFDVTAFEHLFRAHFDASPLVARPSLWTSARMAWWRHRMPR